MHGFRHSAGPTTSPLCGGQGLEGFDICGSRTRSADGQGFDSPQVHVYLTEEQEKELDEAAKKFARTKGSSK